MREILFRGKRLDNGEWVYGAYRECDVTSESAEFKVILAPNIIDFWNRVDKSTVCQYTGLRDKNGKRIFEGDILHIVSYTCDYDFKTSVGAKYGYKSGLYVDGYFDGGDFNEIGFAFDYWQNEDAEIEIIGNIHDNPELLEVRHE